MGIGRVIEGGLSLFVGNQIAILVLTAIYMLAISNGIYIFRKNLFGIIWVVAGLCGLVVLYLPFVLGN